MTNLAKVLDKANETNLKVAHNAMDNVLKAFADPKMVYVLDCDLIDAVYYVNYCYHAAFDRSTPKVIAIEISDVDFKKWIADNKANEWEAYAVSAVSGDVESYTAIESDIDEFLFNYNSVVENYQIMKEYLEDVICQ